MFDKFMRSKFMVGFSTTMIFLGAASWLLGTVFESLYGPHASIVGVVLCFLFVLPMSILICYIAVKMHCEGMEIAKQDEEYYGADDGFDLTDVPMSLPEDFTDLDEEETNKPTKH